jgi:hypothetical protein
MLFVTKVIILMVIICFLLKGFVYHLILFFSFRTLDNHNL